MAIKAQITVNETLILEVDSDPTIDGISAPLSSIVIIDNGVDGKMWIKTSTEDTGWTEIPNKNDVISLSNNGFIDGGSPIESDYDSQFAIDGGEEA